MAIVKAVREAGIADVYNMEVKNHHNFSVEGGLIFHNCRYYLFSRPSPFEGSSFLPGSREFYGSSDDEDEDDDMDDSPGEISNWYGL